MITKRIIHRSTGQVATNTLTYVELCEHVHLIASNWVYMTITPLTLSDINKQLQELAVKSNLKTLPVAYNGTHIIGIKNISMNGAGVEMIVTFLTGDGKEIEGVRIPHFK